MIRGVALPIALLATVMLTLAAGQSPGNKSEEPEPFDIEPPILKQNLSDEPLPDADVARLEKQFERAKRNAEGAERLYKIGVLAKDEVAAKESQVAAGEITKDELEAVKTVLAQLTEAAQVAAAKRERAELEAAEANLRRQQKLLKLGIAQKSDVTDAQEKLAQLKAQQK